MARVMASMPPLDASSATLPRCDRVAPPLDILRITPERRRTMPRAARREHRNAPFRLTPSIWSHHASSPSPFTNATDLFLQQSPSVANQGFPGSWSVPNVQDLQGITDVKVALE